MSRRQPAAGLGGARAALVYVYVCRQMEGSAILSVLVLSSNDSFKSVSCYVHSWGSNRERRLTSPGFSEHISGHRGGSDHLTNKLVSLAWQPRSPEVLAPSIYHRALVCLFLERAARGVLWKSSCRGLVVLTYAIDMGWGVA